MKYQGEVGHLGGLDPRTSANLGIARVFPEPDGDLRFEGRDAAGKRWRVWLPAAAGVGGTDVWTADFDHNGRQDLLISAMFPKNGHCTDGTTLYVLMFDQMGRPVPWVMPSHTFDGYGNPPVGVVDTNGDGRAEIVTVSCEYSDQLATGVLEDRQISGIYEARDARWYPLRNSSDHPYLAIVNPRAGEDRRIARWLPTDPAKWPDFLAGFDGQQLTQLRSLITSAAGCGGIRLPIVDGRVVSSADDPCDSLKYDRVVFSDGEPRQGWPFVVIDSSDGRDVFLSNKTAPLINLLKVGYRFKALGDDKESPSLLWANGRDGTQPGPISTVLRTWEQKRIPLVVEERLPGAGLTAQDIIVNGEQRCFLIRANGENAAQLADWHDCPATNTSRSFRTRDGLELSARQFEPPAGILGRLIDAVAFNAAWELIPFGEGWIAEWQSGTRRGLALHSANGKPLTAEMALPADESLFDSERSSGLSFLRWKDGKPAELIIDLASVEWSRTGQ
jgi:hypothetical protein